MKTLILFIMMLWSMTAFSQTALLSNLAERIGANSGDSVVHLAALDKDAVLCRNSSGELTHVGISLFSNETKEMVNRDVCCFVERLFLQLYLAKSAEDVRFFLESKRISLRYNGLEYGQRGFTSLAKVIRSMEMPSGFTLSNNGSELYAAIEFGIADCIEIKFPASRELVTGIDKKEADEHIGTLLQLSQGNARPAASRNAIRSGNSLYVRRGTAYVADSLRNDVYFKETSGDLVPIFSPEYPRESVLNLFQGYISSDVMLNVKHRKYGGYTLDITVPLNNVISCFDDGYSIYAGINRLRNGKWQCVVVFKNTVYSYLHMLIATFSIEEIFGASAIVDADFYSNIPQDNIKSLF